MIGVALKVRRPILRIELQFVICRGNIFTGQPRLFKNNGNGKYTSYLRHGLFSNKNF